ncbi:hypothetical protein LHJ74_30910 [Streptomyces sp. N2-109]|uniref:Uncharacterized protein n=1 Tax=Streptomyces gossypii TaxID=2883101 RepID=A0ABT2K275_9ACTN|nr:hypothetical protein [Streptomyces gossypii]MCT2594268.1 hypothetical protein [Streptomyces gossypii]
MTNRHGYETGSRDELVAGLNSLSDTSLFFGKYDLAEAASTAARELLAGASEAQAGYVTYRVTDLGDTPHT